jgi:primosomal protein N'
MLALTEWMAERWMARRGEVLEAVLPAGVRLRRKARVSTLLVAGDVDPARKLTPAQARVLAAAGKPATAEQLAQAAGASRAATAMARPPTPSTRSNGPT